MVNNIYNALTKREQYYFNPNDVLYDWADGELIHAMEITDIAIVEASYFYKKGNNIVRIGYMTIPQYRHCGIATYLVSQMLGTLYKAGFRHFRCEINKRNKASIKFLAQFRFEQVSSYNNIVVFDKKFS